MGDFNDKELNLNDTDKVSGGKGEYKVQKLGDNEYQVAKTFTSEEDAKEYAKRRNEMKPHCHGPGCKHDHGGPGMPPPPKPN